MAAMLVDGRKHHGRLLWRLPLDRVCAHTARCREACVTKWWISYSILCTFGFQRMLGIVLAECLCFLPHALMYVNAIHVIRRDMMASSDPSVTRVAFTISRKLEGRTSDGQRTLSRPIHASVQRPLRQCALLQICFRKSQAARHRSVENYARIELIVLRCNTFVSILKPQCSRGLGTWPWNMIYGHKVHTNTNLVDLFLG